MTRLRTLDEETLQRPPPRMGYRQYPRLAEQLSFVARGITQAQARPTDGQIQVLGDMEEAVTGAEHELQDIVEGPVATLNRLLGGQPRILVGRGGREPESSRTGPPSS